MYNILHLDDNAKSTAQSKKDLGSIAEIFPAHTVQDALKLIKSQTFDLFLVEYQLGGGITGFDLATKIRKLPQYKKTPILLTADSFDKKVAKKAMSYKINQCIAISTPADELIEIVEAQIKNPQIMEPPSDEFGVKVLQWAKGDKWYLFAPDIEELIVAESKEDCENILTLIITNNDQYTELSQKTLLKDVNLNNVIIDLSQDE